MQNKVINVKVKKKRILTTKNISIIIYIQSHFGNIMCFFIIIILKYPTLINENNNDYSRNQKLKLIEL